MKIDIELADADNIGATTSGGPKDFANKPDFISEDSFKNVFTGLNDVEENGSVKKIETLEL
eukprot:CAMPEP_0116875052 /NCGR_PEP_ID=MMETSP0463-20121206/6778_1 /TAXON_ID=181622 /ORGANISM="Strombidinopsis sp, Strain SopsisLIS2011" /LENGTH=60 /DNA_ID=CAMNT_0004519839 /DNA_START=343 /DNA_END=525 /DNA_ORIENTATION=+